MPVTGHDPKTWGNKNHILDEFQILLIFVRAGGNVDPMRTSMQLSIRLSQFTTKLICSVFPLRLFLSSVLSFVNTNYILALFVLCL